MRIASSQLSLASSHQLAAKEEERASLRVSVGGTTRTTVIERTRAAATLDAVGISDAAREARSLAEKLRAEEPPTPTEDLAPEAAAQAEEASVESAETPRMRLFRLVFEALTGTQIRASRLAVKTDGAPEATPEVARPDAPPPGWSVAFDYARTYQETEQTSVSAAGVVKTVDGKEISFAVQVTMQRSYSESESTSVRAGNQQLRDPLIIHFDGPAGQLSPGTFAFDIDADGALDDIHFVSQGSAALALDRNQNGVVDDGRELFGARTGDGFGELAAHDSDANGWIDENDAIFEELRLWTRGEGGDSQLRTLREGGVGAIALGAVRSPFQIKDAQNNLQGMVRATSVWLSESGKANTVQQIDLVV